MTQARTEAPLKEAQLDEAAVWVARMRDGLSPETQLALEAWLAENFEHRAAFDTVQAAWSAVGDLGSSPELIEMRRVALANASRAARGRWGRRGQSRALSRASAAAAVLAMLIGATALLLSKGQPPAQVYETAAREHRIITLADDSKISLDENSRVSVSYSRRLRDLNLLRGQAEFEVAVDPLRPFSVAAGGRRIVATGTAFNVDLLESQLFVTLLHGSVVVAPEAQGAGAKDVVRMAPADRLVIDRRTGASRKSTVTVADVEAWKLGKLVFDAEPLASAVARVNRYATRKIVLAAPAQRETRISGVFNIGDSETFADAVSSQLPLRLRHGGGELLLTPR